MKRISLVAISATAAMAQVPAVATTAPMAAAAPVSYATATQAKAPLAPIHDDLIMGNPALPRSLGYLLVTPSDYYGKREAAFQWNGGNTTTFNGTGLAVVDQFFAGFDAVKGQGQLAAGFIAPAFGAGLKVNFDKRGYAADPAEAGDVEEADSTLAPTSFGLFGSAPVGDLTAYAKLDWGTPRSYGSTTFKTGNGSRTLASRSDLLVVGVGVLSAANGDEGLSWGAELEFAHASTRLSGQEDDDASSDYAIAQSADLGKTFSADGYILAVGLKEGIDYINGKGVEGPTDSIPDWGYAVELQPTLATILPVFEHWTVKGGTGLAVRYSSIDYVVGDDEEVESRLVTLKPTALVGIRYERGRWAAEAAVENGFLNRGPNFVSGQSGDLFASFAVTANFK